MSLTVAAAHQEYLEAVGPTLRDSTLYLKQGMLRLHIDPAIGSRLIRTLRKGDVIALVERVRRDTPVQANRVFSEVMALLRWCEQKGYVDGIPSIAKRAVATQEQPRRRTLTDTEIGQLWATVRSMGPLTCDFIRLLLLTGQRSSEVRKITWGEINLEDRLWTIPGTRYKTGVDHVVPLSQTVVDILCRRWTAGAKGYVLANGRTGRPFNGAASAMRRLRKHLGASADFTPHDLRRTVRTGLAKLGVSDLTAEMVIGHQLQGIQRVYDRHDRLE
jgi:integrase